MPHMYKIAILTPQQSTYSTTFIQAHLDLLQADMLHLYGIFFPVASADKQYELKESSFVKKVFNKLKLTKLYKKTFRNPQLIRYLKNEKVDLVFAEFGPVGAEVYDVCQSLNIPLIVHFHGYDAHAYSTLEKYKAEYQAMFQYASFMVVVSNFMLTNLKKLGAPEQKLMLNPYGPRTNFFELKPDFEHLNFIAVGRFVDKKAPHITIQAFHVVYQQYSEARLILVGDGELLAHCQNLVKELNIEKAVIFQGEAAHHEILPLFERAYCFVQHSVIAKNGDAEGTPVAILEAGAAGLPVVATRHAGIQDVIIHGENGFLVAEKDVRAMAGCMLRIAADKNLARQMGEKARQRIKENYTMEKHIAVLNQLIETALNKT